MSGAANQRAAQGRRARPVGNAADADALIRVTNVSMRYADRLVLEHVDLSVHRREIVTVVGPNGSGKTTLVRVALGLCAPHQGQVWRRAGIRTGYVPQKLVVDDTLPLTVRGFLRLGHRREQDRVSATLTEVGAGHVLDAPVQRISGGEMKRVLLARALLGDPELVVLDEPSAGMDVAGQTELYDLIRLIRERRGCGVLLVSHDLHLVMAATDRVICLNHHVCCEGRPEAVSRHPEYLTLFGARAGDRLAVYAHHHDHSHDLAGNVQPR